MTFPEPPRRAPGESIIPMINVVFLLLIFFLMTSQIAPPEPLDVTPPLSASDDPAEGVFRLSLGADGDIAFGEARGEVDALEALSAAREAHCDGTDCAGASAPRLVLRADGAVPGAKLAGLLPRLAAMGFDEVQLVTARL